MLSSCHITTHQVKYRHRRENDEDENFIALAPAEGDDFNLENVLNKDKETRSLPIVRLDSVNNDDDDDEENDEENDNSELKLVNDADNDEKYNRYFDSIDINEERKRILNDTMYTSRSSTIVPVFGIEDDGGDEDYIGK